MSESRDVELIGLQMMIRVARGNRREFLQGSEFLAKICTANSACISQCLFEEVQEGNRFLWMEQWNSLGSLETHLRSSEFRSLLGAVQILGTLEELKLVEFKSRPDVCNAEK